MSRNFAEWMDPNNHRPKSGTKPVSGLNDCGASVNEKRKISFPHYSGKKNGAIEVKRELILKAMQESGFTRISSCCPLELMKMCSGDQYKGNLEVFVSRLTRLMGVGPVSQDNT